MFQLIIASLLFALAEAAPVNAAAAGGNTWQYGTGGGIIGFIVLILDVIVFMEVLKSNRPTLHKVLWCVGVFVFPVVGLIVYYLFSNRAAHNSGSGYEAITN